MKTLIFQNIKGEIKTLIATLTKLILEHGSERKIIWEGSYSSVQRKFNQWKQVAHKKMLEVS